MANEFIQQYNVGQTDRQKEAKGNLFRDGPGDNGSVKPTYSSGPYAQGEQAFRSFLDQGSGGIQESQPPLKFFGPDPSVKKEEEFYGYDVSAEWDINKILLPEGMEAGLGKGITQAVTDVVSLPGGYRPMQETRKRVWPCSHKVWLKWRMAAKQMLRSLGDRISIGEQAAVLV
jgi:hypothetical protein